MMRIDSVGGILVTLGVMLASQTPSRPQTPAQRAVERIRALQREAEALATQESKLLDELRKLEVERQQKVDELAEIDRQQKETERLLAASTARAEELRRVADSDRPDIESRLVQLYKLGRAGYWRLLLDVDDVRSIGRAYRTAAAMTEMDRARIQAHQRTLAELAKERTELQARAKRLAGLEEQATHARVALDRAVNARTALVASIDARRDLNVQLMSELESAQQRLQTSVSRFEADGPAALLPIRPFQGALPWPAFGPITMSFGRQPSSRFGTAIVKNGIEIGVAEGLIVRAVHDGTVAFAGEFTGYGRLVILEHGDGAFSLYGHLGALQVAAGDRVDTQGTIGRSGRNPAGAPALYFELRVDRKPVDPLQWLQRGIQKGKQ
jgi:septal ring factor EnvC (AmiA/AmiB activator)